MLLNNWNINFYSIWTSILVKRGLASEFGYSWPKPWLTSCLAVSVRESETGTGSASTPAGAAGWVCVSEPSGVCSAPDTPPAEVCVRIWEPPPAPAQSAGPPPPPPVFCVQWWSAALLQETVEAADEC